VDGKPEPELPPTNEEYDFLEILKQWPAYTWKSWCEESPDRRARIIAHERHRVLREGWYAEQRRLRLDMASGKKGEEDSSWNLARKQFGLG
jgi:hypothetical protein